MALTEWSASGLPVVQKRHSVGVISTTSGCTESWHLRKWIKTLLLRFPEDRIRCECDAINLLVRIYAFYYTGENKSTKEQRENGVHRKPMTGRLNNDGQKQPLEMTGIF